MRLTTNTAGLRGICQGGLLIMCALTLCGNALASERDIKSDTWTAADALGRPLPGHEECGPPREGKFVGVFYFIWLGQHTTTGPHDITKLLAAKPDDPQWGPANHFHHWGEPELGYYVSTDEWVIRCHARMLANAGVDTIIFDVTNAVTYTNVYLKLCEIYTEMRGQGISTPRVCFLTHSRQEQTVEKLYKEFYSKGLYPDLWFLWRGKPLILAKPDNMPQHIKDFFTFRESWAWSNPGGWFGDGRDKWPWLDSWPQKPGWHTEGVPEQVSVSVAQHPTTNIGRSHFDSKQPDPKELRTAEGLYFAQQWERALEIDPEFIFVTGWNEWVAQRFIAKGVHEHLAGRKLAEGDSFFVDCYTQEYSRDIEPMKGGHTDNYYYQMVANIRRFKGVRAPEKPSGSKTIRIDGRFADWTLVKPEYLDWIGDTEHRDSQGWGDAGRYVNDTGRNDLVRMKVAYDAENIYFYAETKDAITTHTDESWMLLFIDADCDPSTGWNGYDYVVNSKVLDSETTTLAGIGKDFSLSPVADLPYRVTGNKLEIQIPRQALGLADRPVKLDFHWADNIQLNGDIIEFSISGDSAPDRRFNYHFEQR